MQNRRKINLYQSEKQSVLVKLYETEKYPFNYFSCFHSAKKSKINFAIIYIMQKMQGG